MWDWIGGKGGAFRLQVANLFAKFQQFEGFRSFTMGCVDVLTGLGQPLLYVLWQLVVEAMLSANFRALENVGVRWWDSRTQEREQGKIGDQGPYGHYRTFIYNLFRRHKSVKGERQLIDMRGTLVTHL